MRLMNLPTMAQTLKQVTFNERKMQEKKKKEEKKLIAHQTSDRYASIPYFGIPWLL